MNPSNIRQFANRLKPYAIIFLIGVGSSAATMDHPVAWRVDYQTLTRAQFAEKWSTIFWHAIQNHCDKNLDCAWERKYGRIESALDFYGADHCSADTRFFPHIFVEGRVCIENGWSIEVGGAL